MFENFTWQEGLAWLKSHWRWVLAGAGLLLALMVTLYFVSSSHKKDEAVSPSVLPSQSSVSNNSSIGTSPLKVDVKGAVRRPGLYQLKVGDRLEDALQKAGGLTDDADINQLNRAQLLADGMVVYVLKVGEGDQPEFKNAGILPGKGGNDSGGAPASTAEGGKVHLNQASQKELESLSGIGPKKAEQIIAYREQHPFKSIDELKEISGIGAKRFEQLKDQVQL